MASLGGALRPLELGQAGQSESRISWILGDKSGSYETREKALLYGSELWTINLSNLRPQGRTGLEMTTLGAAA